MDTKYDLIVIGGGASGMMAAISASENGRKVLVVEKNADVGEKLKISGGGRCNILNMEEDAHVLLKNYGSAEKYLYTIFSKFGVKESVEFFKKIGIEMKVEDRKRAFPVSEKAIDVQKAMYRKMIDNGVKIILNSSVEKILIEKIEGGEVVNGIKIKNVEEMVTAKKYILATGGYSHPETGSTGNGFIFLKSLGLEIKIVDASPSLVPVAVSNIWVKKLSGKTVENIKLTFLVDGVKKKILKYKKAVVENKNVPSYKNAVVGNRILFTHFGLSGPTILNTSKEISDWLHEGEVTLSLDLFPKLDEKGFDQFLLEIFEESKNVTFKNILNKIYGGNILLEIFVGNSLSEILNKKVNEVRVEERKKIRELLKNLKINITGLMGFDKAIIADGGVDVSEVDFTNMSLKKIKNLFITGDMLNISRPSGGYSLQLCWTTGYVAGSENF